MKKAFKVFLCLSLAGSGMAFAETTSTPTTTDLSAPEKTVASTVSKEESSSSGKEEESLSASSVERQLMDFSKLLASPEVNKAVEQNPTQGFFFLGNILQSMTSATTPEQLQQSLAGLSLLFAQASESLSQISEQEFTDEQVKAVNSLVSMAQKKVFSMLEENGVDEAMIQQTLVPGVKKFMEKAVRDNGEGMTQQEQVEYIGEVYQMLQKVFSVQK